MDVIYRQVVLAREHLLIMGIRNFPTSVLRDGEPDASRTGISYRSLRAMTGNGMHAAAIGTFVTFALGGCSWQDASRE